MIINLEITGDEKWIIMLNNQRVLMVNNGIDSG